MELHRLACLHPSSQVAAVDGWRPISPPPDHLVSACQSLGAICNEWRHPRHRWPLRGSHTLAQAKHEGKSRRAPRRFWKPQPVDRRAGSTKEQHIAIQAPGSCTMNNAHSSTSNNAAIYGTLPIGQAARRRKPSAGARRVLTASLQLLSPAHAALALFLCEASSHRLSHSPPLSVVRSNSIPLSACRTVGQ